MFQIIIESFQILSYRKIVVKNMIKFQANKILEKNPQIIFNRHVKNQTLTKRQER